jgi:hypothetical protein
VLTQEEEALAVAVGKQTLLPLDDWLYALPATIPPFPARRRPAVFSATASVARR